MRHTSLLVTTLLCAVGLPRGARADATLHAGSQTLFPEQIALAVEVVAQVEITTLTLTFPAVTSPGDYVLTVPSPRGASAIGVELDRGSGFAPLAISGRAPPPGVSSGPHASSALSAWEGDTPLLATLAGLGAGPLSARVRFMRLLRRHKAEVSFEVGVDPCPLRPPEAPAPQVTIDVALQTFRPLEEIFAQGITGKLFRPSSRRAVIQFGPAPLAASARAQIEYREQSNGIEAHFLAHRAPDADPLGGDAGYFLLLVDADDAGAAASPPRTLNLVIDRSGSMSGDKMAQARLAALAMLENLRPDDRFNIHAFNDRLSSWRASPASADAANVAAAAAFVRALDAVGSTDLDAGLRAGLGGGDCAPQSEQRFDALVLLSDGLPTAGVTDSRQIHDNALRANCNEARIFTFAVGQDADVPLLEAIARSSRGKSFVLNDAQAATQLGGAVRALFEDIYAVRLTDIQLALSGIAAHDVLPETPGDLFDGGQLLVVGRYDAPGPGAARLAADANGARFTRELPLTAPSRDDENAFIKYLWATEKVGALLAELGRGGDAAAIEQQITELGLGYSIQTPYTSFASTPSPGHVGGGSASGGSSGGSYAGGGYSGGGSSGGGGWGGGDVDLLALGCAALLAALRLRHRRRPQRSAR